MNKPTKATKSFMTGAEYRHNLARLGLNVTTSAKFLQIERSTSRRRATENASISFETAALLRLMVKLHLKPGQVTKLVVDKE